MKGRESGWKLVMEFEMNARLAQRSAFILSTSFKLIWFSFISVSCLSIFYLVKCLISFTLRQRSDKLASIYWRTYAKTFTIKTLSSDTFFLSLWAHFIPELNLRKPITKWIDVIFCANIWINVIISSNMERPNEQYGKSLIDLWW